MARLVFPITFNGKTTLFGTMDAKNTLDGVSSILLIYFAQQAIDIVADRAAVLLAFNNNVLFIDSEKNAKMLHEQCEVWLDPYIKQYKDIGQNLKKFYSKTPDSLGKFGYTLVGNKIVYSTDRDIICTAITKMLNYNNSLPMGTSPITPLYLTQNKINLVQMLADIPHIVTLNATFKQAVKDTKLFSETRDVAIAPVNTHLHGIGTYIVEQYKSLPRTAGKWGYVVDNSPKGAKLTTLKMKLGGTNVLYGVVAGSIIQVTGAATLTIKKGATGTGPAIVLKQGDTWQVAKGYTTMQITNPSLTVLGALTYMRG